MTYTVAVYKKPLGRWTRLMPQREFPNLLRAKVHADTLRVRS